MLNHKFTSPGLLNSSLQANRLPTKYLVKLSFRLVNSKVKTGRGTDDSETESDSSLTLQWVTHVTFYNIITKCI